MSTLKKRISFFDSAEGLAIKQTLQGMTIDSVYNTVSSYSANTDLHPDNLISFTEKHMQYLNKHPSVDPERYISNLRLMTKIR